MKHEAKVEEIIKRMSRKERIALCSGANFWETKEFGRYGIPSLFMCDGPHGLRKQEQAGEADMLGIHKSLPATCFPAEVTTAASWDPDLLEQIGRAIGQEAKEQGVGLVLGPGVNLKRNPLCGRNFEYFSEDPYLAGKLAAGWIRGLEGEGVAASLKHFAANSQERNRFTSDSVMEERTLRELYLRAFEIAVKEGRPSTVMCAYPKLNGIHCSDSRRLLTGILRREWGFRGMVVTDWGAMNNRIRGFYAGCDLNMPGGSAYMEREVLQAVQEGRLPEEAVNRSAARVLKLVLQAAENRKGKEFGKLSGNGAQGMEDHHKLARQAAEAGAVLLKNQDGILPLSPGVKLAVIGAMAKKLRYQGAGSSHINPTSVSQPLEYLPGAIYARGCDDKGKTTGEQLKEAKEAAAAAEAAVVFAGLPGHYESEGFDREHMRMPKGQLQMIEAVAEANPNTVVVLLCGSAVECPWADRVKGILYMGLPGQAGGEAIANLLYGRAEPGGRLAESWPYRYGDCVSSSYYGKGKDALYLEGVYVGYRYYDKAGKGVRWPFGYGLSYTSFTYGELVIKGDLVTVSVANTGTRPGSEVVQLYVQSPQEGIHRPLRELRGFQKVWLKPGESRRVSFLLDDRAFALWQEEAAVQGKPAAGWCVPQGTYHILVGGSSRFLPLSREIRRQGRKPEAPGWQKGSWYEDCKGLPAQKDLEAVMGRPYKPKRLVKGCFTMDNTVEEMREHSLAMRILYKAVEATVAKGFGGKRDYGNPEFRMLMASSAGSPLRCMQISGGLGDGLMQGLLEMANGHFWKGIKRMLQRGKERKGGYDGKNSA